MESLEDYDLARALNFESSRRFLALAEVELASLVLRARQGLPPGKAAAGEGQDKLQASRFSLAFPPLQPKYGQLLHALLVRFDLQFAVQGWGDCRRLVVEASPSSGLLPAVRCADLRPDLDRGHLLPRLDQDKAITPSPLAPPPEKKAPLENAAAEVPGEGGETFIPDHDDRAGDVGSAPPQASKRPRGGRGGGAMHGWSDDDESEGADEVEVPRQPAKAARNTRGRGFLPSSQMEELVRAAQAEDDADKVICVLHGDYTRYAIDPEDTWRPHRKPYVELKEGWEFSNAWSFLPEERPGRETPAPSPVRGALGWRVEHSEAQDFALAFGSSPPEARRWLEGRGGRGEEPHVLAFRFSSSEQRWDFRFGRATALEAAKWRPLPWSDPRRTTFWAATFVADSDGKRYLCAGLDAFPERRFFSARLAASHSCIGFGVYGKPEKGFYVRDIAVFGKRSLLGTPFAGRDHIVEVLADEPILIEAIGKAGCKDAVLGTIQLPVIVPAKIAEPATAVSPSKEDTKAESCSLVVCKSPEQAAEVAAALRSALATGCQVMELATMQRTWPPSGNKDDPAAAAHEAAKSFSEQAATACRSLQASTVRELAFFKELLERKTRHIEGTRIARSAAMRLILAGLNGPAPSPPPPQAGV